MKRATRYVLAILTITVFLLLWFTHSQRLYERALNSLFITFDDLPFGPSYLTALSAAGKDSFDFDFPPPEPHPTNTVPPIIHFIWYKDLYNKHLDISSIPSSGSQAPELCTQRNPGWTINLWNASAGRELLENHYPWFLPTYDNYRHPIQRVDAIKYFILYHYGGIYLDLDVACRKALAPIIDVPAWFPRAQPLGVNNDAMASRRGHPLLWKMCDSLRRRNHNLLFPWITIFWTTGPRFTSDILKEYLEEHGVVGANNADVSKRIKKNSDANAVYVLPMEFYSEEYTFFGHSPGGTWYEGDVAAVLWIADHLWVLGLVPVVLIAGVVLVVRKRRGIGKARMVEPGIGLEELRMRERNSDI